MIHSPKGMTQSSGSPGPIVTKTRQISEPPNILNMARRQLADTSPKNSNKTSQGFQIAPQSKNTTGIKSHLASLNMNANSGPKFRNVSENTSAF